VFPSIRTSRSWTSWKPPIGLPNCSRLRAYASAFSYAPRAHPTAIHATPARVIRSTATKLSVTQITEAPAMCA
jgi:hypothetical protein